MAGDNKIAKEEATGESTPSIRELAEEQIERSQKRPFSLEGQTPEELIHELRVHQVELEMQAEELRRSKLALEESLDKYLDLYYFAPIGYLTLNDKALITDVNLTGATLLGVERNKLVNHGLGRFITPRDIESWDQYFIQLRNQTEKQTCTLMLKRGDGSMFPARLEGLRTTGSGVATTVRIAISDISDIWQIEALRESENKYRSVIENIHAAIMVHNPDTSIQMINKTALDLLGLTPDEAIGRIVPHPPWHFSSEGGNVLPLANYPVNQVLATQKPLINMLFSIFRPRSQDTVWVLVNAFPEYDENGKITEILVTFTDITERKQMEEALKKSETQLLATLQSTADGILAMDNKGKVLQVNRRFAEIWKIPPTILESGDDRVLLDFVLGQLIDPDAFLKKVQLLYDSDAVDMDLLTFKDDRVFERYSSPMIMDGVSIGRVWSFRDITERMRAEEALRKSEEHLGLAIDGSGLGLWDWHVQTGEVIFNEQWANILGYKLAELSPVSIKTWESLCHPDDLTRSNEMLMRHFSKEIPIYECEARMRHKDAHWVWVLDRGKVVEWDADGRPVRMAGTHLDITERKHLAEEISASLLEKETLIKEIHHRVKNNMQVISSLLLLQRKRITDEKTREMFRESENRIFSIALVHEKLYRSSSLSKVDFQDYIRLMGDYLFTSFGVKPGRLSLDIKADRIYLPIDKAIPISLITNELITNSLKHAFPDQRKGSITISITQDKETYRFIFHDDGIGFPPDLDFKNTESLGMQIINGLVGQILGSITLTQEKGSTFEIVFKIIDITEDHHE
jgi:PAS domain S-box-containing protein